MRKIILLVSVLFFCLSVSALEFSPANLEFNLEKNEVGCKKVFFELETSAKLTDVWADNFNDEWSLSDFKTASSELGVQMNYPSEVSSEKKEAEICVSGSKVGNYKGAIIFRQEKVGNSVVQFAVWIKLFVSGQNDEEDSDDDSDGGHSRSSSGQNYQTSWSNYSRPVLNFEEINLPIYEEKISLGKSVSDKESGIGGPILIILFANLVIFGIVLVWWAVGRR